MSISVDLGQLVHSLSDALDLVGVDAVHHGKRVGYMAMLCAERLGTSEHETEDVYRLGLLHDCGVSSTKVHRQLVGELDWPGSAQHCLKGSEILSQVPPLAHLAPMVRFHHTHWDVLQSQQLPPKSALWANLVYLVDRVDALAAPHYERDLLGARHAILETVSRLSGSFFAPLAVETLRQVASTEAFWLSLEPRHLLRFVYQRRRPTSLLPVSFEELSQLAFMFARIVDAKSAFTMEHSLGTARLARFLSETCGLPCETCQKLELAALLHDLGKLQVPDEVLEKPGPLSPEERLVIQRHSFETHQMLSGIPGLEDIALWASAHHERPNGQDYPFHRGIVELVAQHLVPSWEAATGLGAALAATPPPGP